MEREIVKGKSAAQASIHSSAAKSHCGERSDEAISGFPRSKQRDCIASPAKTNQEFRSSPARVTGFPRSMAWSPRYLNANTVKNYFGTRTPFHPRRRIPAAFFGAGCCRQSPMLPGPITLRTGSSNTSFPKPGYYLHDTFCFAQPDF